MDEMEYEREQERYHDDPWAYIDENEIGHRLFECECCIPTSRLLKSGRLLPP
jgi:hypothetical protein